MTRRLKIYQLDELVGTLPAPDSFRLPMSDAEIASIPAMLLARSRSGLFDVRPSDFRLERRATGEGEELVIAAAWSIGPGDFGLLVGFEPAVGKEHFQADDEMAVIFDRLENDIRGRS